MSIIKAYVLPHPPLAVPDVGRGNEKEIDKTLAALEQVSIEIAELCPETIIFVTPHNVMYADYFHISPGHAAKGDLSRFGAPSVRLDASYDIDMVAEIERLASRINFPAGTHGERSAALDHGYTVPAWFVNQKYSAYKAVRICQSGMDSAAHYRFGQIIAKACDVLKRKTVLIASADLSHKLDADGPYGLAPEGAEFDKIVVRVLKTGDFLSLLAIPENLRENAGECGYNSLAILAGCFDRQKVSSKLLSYEGPFGVGYAVASIEPQGHDENRAILERYTEMSLQEVSGLRAGEDHYRALARLALEYMVKTGSELPFPNDVPEDLLKRKAGVFVSLHKNGRLRGCIGTIAPTTQSVAHEIIRNAVSAGLYDNRFERVTESELPHLVYKVDVLGVPEAISGVDELDVKRYGVIVSDGHRRGLLLPNLDGIDTVEEQVSIAGQKAGISENAKVNLERFEVVRYE